MVIQKSDSSTSSGEMDRELSSTPPPAKKFRYETIAVLFLQVCAKGTLFLSHLLFARWLGAEEYGAYVYVIGMVSLLSLFSNLGFNNATVRHVAAARRAGDEKKIGGYLVTISLLVAAIGFFLAFVAYLIGSYKLLPRPELSALLVHSWLLVPLYSLVTILSGALHGLQRVVAALFVSSLFSPALLLITVSSLVFLQRGELLDAEHLLTFSLWIALAAVTILLWSLRRFFSFSSGERNAGDLRSWCSEAFPMYEISITQFVLAQADLLIAGFFLSPTELGIYAAVTRLAQIVTFGIYSVNVPLRPRIARMKPNERHEMQKLIYDSTKLIAAFTLPLLLLLIFGGNALLAFFGEEYQGGYLPLVIVSIGQMMIAFQGSVGTILIMAGEATAAARVTRIAAIANVLFALLLIPPLGVLGAALASALSVSGRSYLLLREVRQRLGVDASIFVLFR
ncbi:flippase [bacterium]|nr:flippase [bacterium]